MLEGMVMPPIDATPPGAARLHRQYKAKQSPQQPFINRLGAILILMPADSSGPWLAPAMSGHGRAPKPGGTRPAGPHAAAFVIDDEAASGTSCR